MSAPLPRWPCAAALLPLVLACGCGERGIPRVPVKGEVLVNGKPLRGMKGAVTFIPNPDKGNESSQLATGALDADGQYVLATKGKPGVRPGHYKVVVSAVPPGADRDSAKLAVPPRYAVEKSTPLEVEVVASPPAGGYPLKLTTK